MASREDLEQEERELCDLLRRMVRADRDMVLRLARARVARFGAAADKGAAAEDTVNEGKLGTSLARLRIAPNNCGVVYFLN